MGIFRAKWALAALAAAGAVLIASLMLRPLWRDEYWALYFSGMGLSLADTVNAVRADVHPPLYFVLLHFWRQIWEHELWIRVFNVVVIVLGALAGWFMRGARKAETVTYLFLCGTSYWIIFYGAEGRMMCMEFVLCALSVLTIRNALDDPKQVATNAIAFCGLGLIAATSHFFGALWFSIAGFCVGVAFLLRGRVGAFVAWGVASAVAIAPVTAWILVVSPAANPGAGDVQPLAAALQNGLNQFLRGLIVKTFFGNLAVTLGAALCLPGLMRKRDPFTLVLLMAVVGTVITAFAIHVFWVNLIKERAFIVMMPAVLYLLAQALHAAQPEQRRVRQLIGAAPIVAILMLPLYSVEYFKDRERIAVILAYFSRHEVVCAGQPIIAHYRVSEQASDFSEYFTRTVLRGADGRRDINLVDARDLAASGGSPPSSTCPLRALALALERGEGRSHMLARDELRAAGIDIDRLEEWSIGRSRALLYIEPGTAAGLGGAPVRQTPPGQ